MFDRGNIVDDNDEIEIMTKGAKENNNYINRDNYTKDEGELYSYQLS